MVTVGDSKGDENETMTTTMAVTTAPPTVAVSNCLWDGNRDRDDGDRDKDKLRGQQGCVPPSPAFCMGRDFSALFVFM